MQAAAGFRPLSFTSAIKIGNRAHSDDFGFDGRIDEIAIFNRALTLADAEALNCHLIKVMAYIYIDGLHQFYHGKRTILH